jgi:hypothetical protein
MYELHIYGTKVNINILGKNRWKSLRKIALSCYQTIPREILHEKSHEGIETDDGTKMALMRPH